MVRRRGKEADGGSREHPSASVHRALDEARFKPSHTLNLRVHLPTGAQAADRAEKWLRERHAARAGEVLVITGRGNRSEGGIPVVRETVRALLARLEREGLVEGVREHTAGSFVVKLRRPGSCPPVRSAAASPLPRVTSGKIEGLEGLDARARDALESLALAVLTDIGVRDTSPHLAHEMRRQLTRLVSSGIPLDPASVHAAIVAELERLEG